MLSLFLLSGSDGSSMHSILLIFPQFSFLLVYSLFWVEFCGEMHASIVSAIERAIVRATAVAAIGRLSQ